MPHLSRCQQGLQDTLEWKWIRKDFLKAMPPEHGFSHGQKITSWVIMLVVRTQDLISLLQSPRFGYSSTGENQSLPVKTEVWMCSLLAERGCWCTRSNLYLIWPCTGFPSSPWEGSLITATFSLQELLSPWNFPNCSLYSRLSETHLCNYFTFRDDDMHNSISCMLCGNKTDQAFKWSTYVKNCNNKKKPKGYGIN